MSYQFGHIDPDERLDYAEEPPPADEYPPRRHLPGVILALGVMVIFAGGLWFAYHEGAKHAQSVGTAATTPGGQVPLIRADTEPVKVKPDKAGGMSIPDKDDPIYSMRPGSNPVEKLLPAPEAPAPRPTAPPPPPATPAEPPAVSVTPAQLGPKPQPAPPQVAALPRPAPWPEPTDKPAATGAAMRIQLASLRTPDEARDEWARLKRENGDLLGKLTAVAVRADLGERGIWYRVEAGPVGDKAMAVKLCGALKERGLGCSLVK